MLKRLLPWPLPALLVWSVAWGLYGGLARAGAGFLLALAAACMVGVLCSLIGNSWWRRAIIAGGFPASWMVAGAAVLPPWAWLLLLALLALIYPLNAWRDAPVFPTPDKALKALPSHAPLVQGSRVLDAGCGLGQGLHALRAAYPLAQLHGIEWSWPLRALCAWHCPWARIRQGDMWRANWAPYAMVYLFQRPESMGRAMQKASQEMVAGSWLVSLEFEATDFKATAVVSIPDGRPLWLYQLPCARAGAT